MMSYLTSCYGDGVPNLYRIYVIVKYIETGVKPYAITMRVSKKDREYLINRYNLKYSKTKRIYTNSHEEVFKLLKEDYPEFMRKHYCNDYNHLYQIIFNK